MDKKDIEDIISVLTHVTEDYYASYRGTSKERIKELIRKIKHNIEWNVS